MANGDEIRPGQNGAAGSAAGGTAQMAGEMTADATAKTAGTDTTAGQGLASPSPYRWPLLWSAILLVAILLLLGWLGWQAWQQAEANRKIQEKLLADTREANLAREDFIQHLKVLLQYEPCALQDELTRLRAPAGIIWPPLGLAPVQAGSPQIPDHGNAGPDNAEPDNTGPADIGADKIGPDAESFKMPEGSGATTGRPAVEAYK